MEVSIIGTIRWKEMQDQDHGSLFNSNALWSYHLTYF